MRIKVEPYSDPRQTSTCDGHMMSGRKAEFRIEVKGQILFVCRECATDIYQQLGNQKGLFE